MSTPGSFQKRGACGVFMSHVEAETPADHPREWGKAVQSTADRPKPDGVEMGAFAVRITYAPLSKSSAAPVRPASASSLLMKKKKYAWSSRLNLEYNRRPSAGIGDKDFSRGSTVPGAASLGNAQGQGLSIQQRQAPAIVCPLPHPLRNRQPSLSSPPASTATRDIRSCRVYSIAPLQPVVTVT